MKTHRNKYYLLNYIFVICAVVLFINDHYLKLECSNWLTGKLSDAVGIIILPLLLIYLFPGLKGMTVLVSALLFIFWKSECSQCLIDLYNKWAVIPITRAVDYTDLIVLGLLPIPSCIIKRIDRLDRLKIQQLNAAVVLIPTAFILMSTSPPADYYYTRTNGNLYCYRCKITVNYNQAEIVQMLQKHNITFDEVAEIDPGLPEHFKHLKGQNIHTYKINALVIDKDTLRNIDFSMRTLRGRKTNIYFNGMNVPDDISDEKLARKLRRYYRKMIFSELRGKMRD